jgi:hypothetical protein
LTLVSSQTGFNHHLRYVLPVFPFAFIWASRVTMLFPSGARRDGVAPAEPPSARQTEASDDIHYPRESEAPAELRLAPAEPQLENGSPFTSGPRRPHALQAVVCAALAWSVLTSLWVYPHSLSYFNELVGGPMGGHYHLGNSNIDWGQDLLYLKRWLDEHPEASPIGLAYDLPLVEPKTAGIESTAVPVGPWSEPGQGLPFDQLGPQPGWYAISVNQIQRGQRDFAYFLRFQPVARAGYSIYIYHITLDEANRVRRELGIPPLGAPGSRLGKSTSPAM